MTGVPSRVYIQDMETTQLLLILTVSSLTIMLLIVGSQVALILREFRESVKKMNKILDDAGVVSESVAKPIAGLSGFLTGIKSGADLIKLLTSGKPKN